MRVQRVSNRSKFRILHCLRAPVGGLFRHVCDLAAGQQCAGHEVAVICASTGDALTEARLAALSERISLGVHRIASSRNPGLTDLLALQRVKTLARSLDIDVLHGHGAKGGAYARLASRSIAPSLAVYTPHGGSLHYAPTTLAGRAVSSVERSLERYTAGLIFESRYAADRYAAQIGPPRVPFRIVPNGVTDADFAPALPAPDASDVLFVGELRHLKGIDVLIEALALVATKRPITATIVGAGPDRATFEALAQQRGLASAVRFTGALPAREAFTMGRLLVLPSRAESFPYIVLEAGAASLPQILTRVGGIPEIVGDTPVPMLTPGDPKALATALLDGLLSKTAAADGAVHLAARVRSLFHVSSMTTAVLQFYDDLSALAAAKSAQHRLAIAAE
jgi:glycosyltransferase involved in cell wall biosynthesis